MKKYWIKKNVYNANGNDQCTAIKCAGVLNDYEYWMQTVNPVHKQWCTSPMWLGYFSWAKKDFLRIHISTI